MRDVISGTIIIPITIPAEKALSVEMLRCRKCPILSMKGGTNVSEKYPYTIVGIPAMISITGFINLLIFPGVK